jgi:hypothetical protein
MRSTTVWGLAVLLSASVCACGDLEWRKNGGGTRSQFNDDTYACNLIAARVASTGMPASPAPAADPRAGCTSRGEGLTECRPAPRVDAASSAPAAEANATMLDRHWRECMHERGWREVKDGNAGPR